MSSPDLVIELMSNSSEAGETNPDVYYFKDWDGTKYRFNLMQYFKFVKIYGPKIELSNHLVLQRNISSQVPQHLSDVMNGEVYLCSSADSYTLAAFNVVSETFSLYQFFPSFKEIFKYQMNPEPSFIDLVFSESNKMMTFASYHKRQSHYFMNMLFFKYNIRLTLKESCFSQIEKIHMTVDDDTIVFHESYGFPQFLHICHKLPDKFYKSTQVCLQISQIVMNRLDGELELNLSSLGETQKLFVNRLGQGTYKSDMFVIYVNPNYKRITEVALNKKYESVSLTLLKTFVEVLGFDTNEITTGIHCIFSTNDLTYYYAIVSTRMPFFPRNEADCKSNVELVGRVDQHTTFQSVLRGESRYGLQKYRTAPFSVYKHFSTDCFESLTSIEPQHGGIEYMLNDPDRAEIAKLPFLDLKSRFS